MGDRGKERKARKVIKKRRREVERGKKAWMEKKKKEK